MLHELDIERWKKVANLFDAHILARSIINPCIQSGIGSLSVDDVDSPSIAMYSIPMMMFFAGDATSPLALELVKSLPHHTIFIVPDEKWSNIIKEVGGERLVVNRRTHFDYSTLNITHLRKLKEGLPEEYTLKRLNEKVLSQIDKEYAVQIQMYYGNMKNLVKAGFGFHILDDKGRLASYAYTPFPFTDEFEIQVFTKNSPEYRRKGLATVVCAALIEHGLDKKLVPHWDAANNSSVNLALKLGYSNPKAWEAFYFKPE
jgi:RimJ/RimL family protein N-acetyltransferase